MTGPASDISGAGELHLPWESVGADEGERARSAVSDASLARQLPLTPWAEPCGTAALGCDVTDSRRAGTVIDQVKSSLQPDHRSIVDDNLPARLGNVNGTECIAERGVVGGGGWTLPLLCAGIALIACCVLIPQADANRRLAYERQVLQLDLDSIERQIDVNAEFLKKVGEDPTLAQRLAERQMKVVPEGTRVLELKHAPDAGTMSPFQLVSVEPPPALPPYKSVGGLIANLCYDARARLSMVGAAMGMIAAGLVLGYAPLTARSS